MTDYSGIKQMTIEKSYGITSNASEGMLPLNPLECAEQMVVRHADELSVQYNELEERIAVVGQELDTLKRAREVLHNALLGTEKLRSSFQKDQPTSPIGERG